MPNYIVSVRYGMMMNAENFQTEIEGLQKDMLVIVRSSRGVDYGTVASKPEEVDRPVKGIGEVMRIASETDIGIIQHIKESKEPEELSYCRDQIKEKKLPMRMVGVEHLFSSDKIIFYFLADGRVDFRELVKDLARRYRTRIEMRQIGVRDESRLLADYGHCGRELCCRTFMKNLDPVTMRMAKMQKTTLDPSKISGHCGRLMCCLRFEDEVYMQLKKEMPQRGIFVQTPQFRGKVVGQTLLKQEVTIEMHDGTREIIHLSEITGIEKKPKIQQNKNLERKRDNRDESKNNNKANSENNKSEAETEPKPDVSQEDSGDKSENGSEGTL